MTSEGGSDVTSDGGSTGDVTTDGASSADVPTDGCSTADVTSHRGSGLMLPLISLCVIYSNCFVLTIHFSDFVGPLAVCNVLLY